jgi:hypothetical protein
MQILGSGKLPVEGWSFMERLPQNFYKSLTGEIISVLGVAGVFKGQVARGRQKLIKSRTAPLVITIYFHAIPAPHIAGEISFACRTRRRHPGKSMLEGNMESILPL